MVFGISSGVCLVLVMAIGAVLWYSSIPSRPKPWDTKAVTASYDYVSTEGDSNTFVFFYVVENKSQRDYRLTETMKPVLMAQLAEHKSLGREDDSLRINLPLFIPAGHRHTVKIHLDYRFKEPHPKDASRDQRRAYKAKLEEHLKNELSNLDGFVLFDDETRYQIIFPKGW